jgi:hypothetical protein
VEPRIKRVDKRANVPIASRSNEKKSSGAQPSSNIDITGGVAAGPGPKGHELPIAGEEMRPVASYALGPEELSHKLKAPLRDGLCLRVVLYRPLNLLDEV